MRIENDTYIIEANIHVKPDEKEWFLNSLKEYKETGIADICIINEGRLWFKVPNNCGSFIKFFDKDLPFTDKKIYDQYVNILINVSSDIKEEKYNVDFDLSKEKVIIKIQEKIK